MAGTKANGIPHYILTLGTFSVLQAFQKGKSLIAGHVGFGALIPNRLSPRVRNVVIGILAPPVQNGIRLILGHESKVISDQSSVVSKKSRVRGG